MKILRVISSMNPVSGGPCQGIRYLVPELEAMGVQNEIVCLDPPDAAFLKRDNLTIHALGPARSNWAYSPNLHQWLEHNISRFDCVIQHGMWQYTGYALLRHYKNLLIRGLCPKWYIYPHGMLDPWFQQDKSRRLKALRNWIYWKVIERRVVQSADALLFTCEEEMQLGVTTFKPFRPRKVENVGYGIPVPDGEPRAQTQAFYRTYPELEGKRFLLFLSRIHPKKGLDVLLQAYAQNLLANDSDGLTLVVAGPCADVSYWNKLQQLAVSLGLQTNALPFPGAGSSINQKYAAEMPKPSPIVWAGMLTGFPKWGALRAAQAFILPSHQENFGISAVEALACGTPVLISKRVNIHMDILSENAGLVEDDSVSGVSNLLCRWRQLCSSAIEEMRLAAKSCYQKNFSAHSAAEKLKAFLESDGRSK